MLFTLMKNFTNFFFFQNVDSTGLVGDFPGGSNGKELACNAADLALIPGSGRSHGEGNGYPLQ